MTIEKLTAGDPDTQSAPIISDHLDRLRELFPEAFTEGRVDFDVLRQVLGDDIDQGDERYGLNWRGKRAARRLALTPSTGTLRPAPDESVDWDTTQNLMIEGDNLEVLKLLRKSYGGNVKLVYIDPPYNTGKDFVYLDDFQDNIKNYLEMTGQVGEGGRLTSNTETSGRFHTDWLNMMYPRLMLAREMLRADGLILISVDDAEVANLRSLCDEVFGSSNFVATLVWDRNRKNDARYFSVGHDYMLCYFKNQYTVSDEGIVFRGDKEGVDEVRSEFERLRQEAGDDWSVVRKGLIEFYSTIPDDDPRAPLKRFTKVDEKGPYRDDGNINWPGGGGPRYEVLHPLTQRPCKLPVSGWRYPTPERFWEEVTRGRIIFGEDESTVPRVRTNLFENSDEVMVSVHYSYAQTAANQFSALFDGARVFDNPKPVEDLRRLIAYLTDPDDTVMDFFAGSGTTAHATMARNAEDDGRRRFILVQLPEPLSAENRDQEVAASFCEAIGRPANLAEITKERLRRAGAKVREEHPLFAVDVGFRVFKLDSSNIREWDPQPEDLEVTLDAAVENLKADRTEEDILYELLLKRGIELTVPIETREIAGKPVHSIGAGTLFACLDERIERTDAEPVALGIVAWRDELAPAGDIRVVFRDSAFVDDVAKTNLAEILRQHGLADVKSI